ncbi:MAG: hypothetical protein H6817_03555 [Phycisphaerales bacterium]|nr:hypothetical protein [Phycisphaerales bacterium]
MHAAIMGMRSNPVRFPFSLFVATLLIAATSAAAQDESDEVNDSERPRYFSLDRLDGYLELETQFDQTRVRSELRQRRQGRRQWSQTNRDVNIEERFGLGLGGTIIDPSFITFQADLSFALTQSHFSERSPTADYSDDDSGTLLLYDARMNFFQGKPLSGSVYAIRRDDRINRRFQPSLDERQTGFGTDWSYVADDLSMHLRYDYLETDRTGNRDRYDDEHYTDSTLNYGVDWTVSRNHTINATYEHAENKQEYQGLRDAYETTRDLIIVDDRFTFGTDDANELWTRMRWQEESGDFARDIFEIGPQLTLKHNDNLSTIYRYQFNREKYEAYDISTHRADFQLIHQLYTNLTTTVDVFGLYEDIDNDVQTTQYGALIDWQYNRKNPYGQLWANLALAYDTEDVNGDNGSRVVLNESATFRGPTQITLRHANVIPGTIVVTDSANRRVYQPLRDYLIVTVGQWTQISRIATGRILDDETILIDYEYSTPADGKLDTMRVDFSLEQRFDNGLTPYYRLSYRNQEADYSRGFARYADRTNHHRIGIRYEQPKYTLGAEYEIYDDTVEPFDAFHLNGLYRFIQTSEHSLDASVRFSRFFFEGGVDQRNVSWLDLQLDHRWYLRESLSSFERVTYRWQDDSVRGTTNAWDVSAGFDYAIGELTAEFVVEYDRLDVPGSEEDDVGVYFRLRRDFENVLARN